MFRILALNAASTARSRSASSSTRNGALPPSSIDVRRTPRAACASRSLPTSVDPVNDSLRMTPLSSISGTTSAARLVVHDAQHTLREAGLGQDLRERQRAERGLRRRLQDADAPGRDRRTQLAGAHGQREVPRDDQQRRADRLLDLQVAGGPVGPVGVPAVDADGLLGEPAEELRRVRDLAAGLGQGLAHLEGHQERELLGALDHQLVGAVQDLRADAGGRPRPGLLGALGRLGARLGRRARRRPRRRSGPPRWPGSPPTSGRRPTPAVHRRRGRGLAVRRPVRRTVRRCGGCCGELGLGHHCSLSGVVCSTGAGFSRTPRPRRRG